MDTADINWLNTAETARRLGITPRTLYRFIDDGSLPAYRFGRVIRLKESEVADFIERCRIQPGTLDMLHPDRDEDAGQDEGSTQTSSPSGT
ncbi:MAG: helix-turn-helix domain-containing protein [Microthrixaceae bacterium]